MLVRLEIILLTAADSRLAPLDSMICAESELTNDFSWLIS